MSRRSAGNSWSGSNIRNAEGEWVHTIKARGWRKCPRCRAPFEHDPFDSGLCPICYFYHSGLPIEEFWRINNANFWLAPYNIGRPNKRKFTKPPEHTPKW